MAISYMKEKLAYKNVCATGNYIQYSDINHNGKNMKKNICVQMNHFAIEQKLIHYKSIILE